jgi:hypothetical protein
VKAFLAVVANHRKTSLSPEIDSGTKFGEAQATPSATLPAAAHTVPPGPFTDVRQTDRSEKISKKHT